MNQEEHNLYIQKLETLESKFQIITEKYSKVIQELNHKNSIIQELTNRISQLEHELGFERQKYNQLNQEIKNIKGFRINSRQHFNTNVHFVKSNDIAGSLNLFKKVNEENTNQESYEQQKPSLRGTEESIESTQKNNQFSSALNNLKRKLIENKAQPISFQDRNADMNNTAKTSLRFPQSETMIRNKSLGSIPQAKAQSSEALQKIWQERDEEIKRMDQLFQTLNYRLKKYD